MKKTAAASLAALCLFCASVEAATTSNLSVGPHAGAAFLGDSGGTHFDFGGWGSYEFAPPIFGALDFSYIDRGGLNINGTQATGSLYLAIASINYDASGFYPGSYIGAAMGVGFDHLSVSSGAVSTSNTNTNFYIGPQVGYDYPLSATMTFGGKADWLITSHSNEPNVFEIQGLLKFWL